MFLDCANPECSSEFDYRQGCLYRFHKQPLDGHPANTHSVQHLWLCKECARVYRLDYEPCRGIFLRASVETGGQTGLVRLVAAA